MNMIKEKEKLANKRKVILTFGIFCFFIFLVSSSMIIIRILGEIKDVKVFEELSKQIIIDDEETAFEGYHKYDLLHEQNPDLFGWVKIEDTDIDYPVMHTPEDPEYYLRRAFDKSDSISGVPFLDGESYLGCGNYIVYGHHVTNGTVFATLLKYADKAFYDEHPIINFDTLEKEGRYVIIAVFYAHVYYQSDTDVFRYYNYPDLTDEETFNEYISQVKQASLYDIGISAQYGDQLLTLTTCSYHMDDGRFVVVAKEIKE